MFGRPSLRTAVDSAQSVAARDAALRFVGLGSWARLGGTVMRGALTLASTAIIVRALGTRSYGVLAVTLTAAAIVALLLRLGLEPALARSVSASNGRDAAAEARPLARAALVVSLAAVPLGAAAGAYLAAHGSQHGPTLAALAAGAGLYAAALHASGVVGAILRGLGRLIAMELPALVLAGATFCAVVTAAAYGATLRSVAVAYGGASALALAASAAVAYVVTAGAPSREASFRAVMRLLALSAPFSVTALAWVMVARFDVVVLGLARPATDVGRYEPMLRVVERVMLPASLFAAPFLPAATRLVTSSSRQDAERLYHVVTKIAYIAAFPGLLLLAGFPEKLMHALYGASFSVNASVVYVLLAGFAVNVLTGLNTSVLAALGLVKHLALVGSSAVVVMAVLALTLIPVLGVVGAALATALTLCLMNVVCTIVLVRGARVRPFDVTFAVTAVTSAVPIAGLVALRAWWPPATLFQACVWVVGAWSIWLGALAASGAVSWREARPLLAPVRASG